MTQREQQVLAMIGRGYSIPKIAERLFRSQKTIETHRQSLGRKLGASNRVELARIAIQVGLAPLDFSSVNVPAGTEGALAQLGVDERAAEVLRRIESSCAGVVDVAYARALCQALSHTLGTTGAGLFSCEDDKVKIRSVAMVCQGAQAGEVSMDLAGSPCEQTMKRGLFRCEGVLGQACPKFEASAFFDIQSYMGVKLDHPITHEPLGALVVFLDQSTTFDPAAEAVLRVCSRRASAELGRMQLIDSLQRSVESLEEQLAQVEAGG